MLVLLVAIRALAHFAHYDPLERTHSIFDALALRYYGISRGIDPTLGSAASQFTHLRRAESRLRMPTPEQATSVGDCRRRVMR